MSTVDETVKVTFRKQTVRGRTRRLFLHGTVLVDYLVAAALVALALGTTQLVYGHVLDPGELPARRNIYTATMTASLAVVVAVQTWTSTLQGDRSVTMGRLLRQEATAIRRLRYGLIGEALVLVVADAVALLVDLEHGARGYTFWVWGMPGGAVAVCFVRNLTLQYDLHRTRDLELENEDELPAVFPIYRAG